MKTSLKHMVAAAFAGLAFSCLADESEWKRMVYPDRVRQWPQLKGMMLGASGEREFADLHAMGATLVRYQLHADWNRFANSTNAAAAFDLWLGERLDHLEKMLAWSRKYGIMICVDMHTHLGGFTKEKYSSDMIFVEKAYADLLVATWEKIARRFKGNEDAIYGYDLFNEPIDRENKLTTTTWRAVMCRTVEAVRAIDPVTPIVIEPNCNASPNGFDVKNPYGLKGFEPLPYDNLIYSVHVYRPMAFTHQGISQRKEDYRPVRYPGGLVKDGVKSEVWDKEFVRREVRSVRDFQLKTGARIFVGEFSAAAYAPGAELYLNDLCELFCEYGWDWTYHAFREATCWSLEHEGASFYEMVPAKEKTARRKVIEKFLAERRP